MEKTNQADNAPEMETTAEAEVTETVENAEAAENTENREPTAEELAAAAMEKLQGELDATKDQYRRMLAEYDNYRKRTQREKESIRGDAIISVVGDFLPVLDNLERAAAQETADEAYKKGVEMTLKQLYECLSKLNVKEIPAQGEQFDPEKHNAVMHVEDETCDDNTVVEVFQKGFTLGDRVVRHSMVKVAN